MRKLSIVLMVLAAVTSLQAATTLKVNIGSALPYQVTVIDNAANPGDDGWGLYGYAIGDQFKTFCVERYDEFTAGNYFVTIDDVVKYPDLLPGSNWDNTNQSDAKELTELTKRIYAAYLAGQYSSYSDTQIQNSIWGAQKFSAYSVDGDIKTIAENYSGTNWKQVKVLNLWSDASATGGFDRQSHLILVPAPGAIMLASMGMGLVSYLRRRQSL